MAQLLKYATGLEEACIPLSVISDNDILFTAKSLFERFCTKWHFSVQTIINRHAMFRQMCTRTDNKERCADMQFDTMKKIAEHMQSEKDARDVVPNAHTEPISTWAFLFTAQRAPKISACLISASTGGHVCQGRAKASSKRYVRW